MRIVRIGDHDIAGIHVNRAKTFSAKCFRNQTARPAFAKAEQPIEGTRSQLLNGEDGFEQSTSLVKKRPQVVLQKCFALVREQCSSGFAMAIFADLKKR